MFSRLIKVCIAFIAAVLFDGCVDRFAPPATQTQFGYLVVDGFLLNGTDSTIIKLSRSQTLFNTPNDNRELGAVVQIEEENGSSTTLKDNQNGSYSVAPLTLRFDKKYRLKIKTADANEYVSDFVPVKKSGPLNKVTLTQGADDIRISLDTYDPTNESRHYFWTYEETWKYSSYDYSIYKYENGSVVPRSRADEIQYCWKTSGSNKISIFSTSQLNQDAISDYDLLHIPYNSRKLYYEYSIRVIQHALTEEAYQYWLLTVKNNENIGSIYSSIPSKVEGNIRCTSDPDETVIGYFSATSIESNRVSVLRGDLTGPSVLYEPSGYESCHIFVVSPNYQYLDAVVIHDIAYNDAAQQIIGYKVGTPDCMDCRKKGGTTVRPPYWN
jgi:hypothetical protein